MADRMRLRFQSGRFDDREFQRFYQWNVALRYAGYGHVESLEPWRAGDATYEFKPDSVEFTYGDWATKSGLAEAARDLGGMVVEEWADDGWREIACEKPQYNGIGEYIATAEAQAARED